PNMREVVKAEVLKLLYVGIIYPISDSQWVSPTQWTEQCWEAFTKLKGMLTTAPIMQPPDWSLPFELMCGTSDYALGAVLGQRKDKRPYVIHYAKFDLEIKDKKGVENIVADHLSRLNTSDSPKVTHINDMFPNEQLFRVSHSPWFADIVNYLTTGSIPTHWTAQDKKKFFTKVRNFFWDDPYLFKYYPDQILRRCVPDDEYQSVISFCHSQAFAVYYVTKWVEAIPCRNNDHRTVIKFLKENILSRFGTPRAIISDGGSHFCNRPFESLMKKYGISHKVSTSYHPQIS
ncbi:uncharacterized protein LOC131248925, partial [Magnolia sinica]|uniref:uncharacterized protein LOC131248925 n=1 Tax=Magnolia sinica TaxID=86752 RepID=UPI0026587AC9